MANKATVELPDPGGLICGFRLGAGGGTATLPWQPGASLPVDAPVWLHFNLADNRARNWLAACEALSPEARESLLDATHQIKLEVIDDAIVGVLGDLHHDFDQSPEGLGYLRVYVDADRAITVRRHPLKATDQLRRELLAGLELETPLQLLSQLLENIADIFDGVVTELADAIDEAEDRILRGRYHQESIELSRARQLLARIRRHVGATRHTLAMLRLPRWASMDDQALVRRATSRLESVGQDIDLVQVRARLLQEEIAGRLGEATNRNIYFLSIVTTLFLPITLISGVFGMNVEGLPWLHDAEGFWWVLAIMALTIVASVLVLRWRRLF